MQTENKSHATIHQVVVVILLALCSLTLLPSCHAQKSQPLRVVIPSSLTGLFQIEGRASQPNGVVMKTGGVVTLTMPQGARYLGLATKSPFVDWYNVQFVGDNGNTFREVHSPLDLTGSERGVLVFGIVGRSELSWFAIGNQSELLNACRQKENLLDSGLFDLP